MKDLETFIKLTCIAMEQYSRNVTNKLLGVPVIISSVVIIPWDPLGVVGVWSPSFEFVDCESKFVKAVKIKKLDDWNGVKISAQNWWELGKSKFSHTCWRAWLRLTTELLNWFCINKKTSTYQRRRNSNFQRTITIRASLCVERDFTCLKSCFRFW